MVQKEAALRDKEAALTAAQEASNLKEAELASARQGHEKQRLDQTAELDEEKNWLNVLNLNLRLPKKK